MLKNATSVLLYTQSYFYLGQLIWLITQILTTTIFRFIVHLLTTNHSLPFPEIVFVSQSLSCVQQFVTLWTVAHQASLSFINPWSLLKLMTIEPVMPSNHLILCLPFLCLPSNLSQYQDLFQWVSPLHKLAKVLELQLQHQSLK